MKLSKPDRKMLFDKYGGRCAYCGKQLPERWHADHFEPVLRGVGRLTHSREMERPENDRIDNFMPSCPPCNLDKHAMSLEHWREWLAVRLKALSNQPGFRLLESHGLVAQTGNNIQFYFEKFHQDNRT